MMITIQKKYSTAFTLIELMVVTMFLAVIGVYTWSYLKTTLKTQKSIEQKTDIQQNGISILSRLTDDITQVFIIDSYQKLTLFKGDQEELTFTSLSHDSPDPNGHESEEAKITYALDSDPDAKNTSTKVLTRKEVPYFTPINDKDDAYKPMIVAHGVKDLQFSYSSDGLKYVNDWDTTSGDHPNKLPLLVKISFTISDDNDREEFFETLIDLPMTDDINTQGTKAGTSSQTGKTGTGTSNTGQTGTNSNSGTTSNPSGGSNPGVSNPVTRPGGSSGSTQIP